ncbi:MAG: hypothetical protein JSV44_04260, partial [Candidatus Zixiibacteriota bacterium]
MTVEDYHRKYSIMLSKMVSWLVLSQRGDQYGYQVQWGKGCKLSKKAIFNSSRALYALCASYPYILDEHLYNENREQMSLKELDAIMFDNADWLIKMGVNDTKKDTVFWWSGDNTPIEIPRSTCAVLNALIELRERCIEKKVEVYLQDDAVEKLESYRKRLDDVIEKGLNWIVSNITAGDMLVTNATTGDQAVLLEGGFSNIPYPIYEMLIYGNFDGMVADYDPSTICNELCEEKYNPQSILNIGTHF